MNKYYYKNLFIYFTPNRDLKFVKKRVLHTKKSIGTIITVYKIIK